MHHFPEWSDHYPRVLDLIPAPETTVCRDRDSTGSNAHGGMTGTEMTGPRKAATRCITMGCLRVRLGAARSQAKCAE